MWSWKLRYDMICYLWAGEPEKLMVRFSLSPKAGNQRNYWCDSQSEAEGLRTTWGRLQCKSQSLKAWAAGTLISAGKRKWKLHLMNWERERERNWERENSLFLRVFVLFGTFNSLDDACPLWWGQIFIQFIESNANLFRNTFIDTLGNDVLPNI